MPNFRRIKREVKGYNAFIKFNQEIRDGQTRLGELNRFSIHDANPSEMGFGLLSLLFGFLGKVSPTFRTLPEGLAEDKLSTLFVVTSISRAGNLAFGSAPPPPPLQQKRILPKAVGPTEKGLARRELVGRRLFEDRALNR